MHTNSTKISSILRKIKNIELVETNLKEVAELLEEYNTYIIEDLKIVLKGFNLENCAILGVGSLALKKLSPASDVDIVILGNIDKKEILELTHTLQDNFHEVSISVFDANLNFKNLDYKVLISFLNTIYLGGNLVIYDNFIKDIKHYYRSVKSELMSIILHNVSKTSLEPSLEFDIKTVAGGIREQSISLAINKRTNLFIDELNAIRTLIFLRTKSTLFSYKNFKIADFSQFRAKVIAKLQNFAIKFREYLSQDSVYFKKTDILSGYFIDCNVRFSKDLLDSIYYNGNLFKIKEFAELRGYASENTFHHYPVVYHSVKTAKHLFEVLEGVKYEKVEFFYRIAKSLSDRQKTMLTYAAILHDIAKPSLNHPRLGSTLIKRKFKTSIPDCLSDICFIVENHLIIHQYATSKNIADASVLDDFLRTVGESRVDILFLFTYLDMLATYGKVNKWYLEQYLIFYRHLKMHTQGGMMQRDGFLSLNEDSNEVLSLELNLESDRIGIFYVLLETIAKFNGDIFYALISKRKGRVYDIFKLKNIRYKKSILKEELELSLSNFLKNKVQINSKLEPIIDVEYLKLRQEKNFTVMEIKLPDRQNLLRDIARLLYEMKVNVEFASITSIEKSAVDVFHLTKDSKPLDNVYIENIKKVFKNPKVVQNMNILNTLEENISFVPVIDEMKLRKEDPFKILVTVLMSARTKDELSNEASKRLFKDINTPTQLLKLSTKEIEKRIYPVGFYKTKAKHIKELAKILVDKSSSKVPDNIEELMSLPGVGFKTATLVMATVFDKEEICVDTHVHRISNYLGFVETKNPIDTHWALKEVFPSNYWQKINYILVSYGKTVCKPLGPRCKQCVVSDYCKNNIS